MSTLNTTPKQKPVSLPITNDMMDCIIHDIKRTVETSITGSHARDNETDTYIMRDKLDVDGVAVVDKHGDIKTEHVPVFETINIKITIDFTGATLAQLVHWMIAKSNSITVAIQNKYRPLGADAINAINGTTIMFSDLLIDSKTPKTPTMVTMASLAKIKDPVEKQKQTIALMEMLQNSLDA